VTADRQPVPETVLETGSAIEHVHMSAFEAAFDGVIVADREGRVRVWNRKAEDIFGYKSEDALGRTISELIVPADLRERHEAGMRRIHPGDGSMNVNRRVRFPAVRADRSSLEVELSIAPHMSDGALLFVGFVREVAPELRWGDELVERESELRSLGERLRTLVANLFLGVIIEDEHRNLLLANEEMFRLFAMDRNAAVAVARRPENVGAAFAYLFADPEGFLARREEILERREMVVDERVVAADGRVLERDYVPIFVDGDYAGHVWLWRDISAQAAAELSRDRALSAEQEITRTLQEQNTALAELNRLKSEFVATVSHELRTPLTSVVGFSELLADDDTLSSEQREYVDVIERSAERLLRLVGDLMLLARAESGGLQLELSEIDVAHLCRDAVVEAAPAHHGRGVLWESDIVDGPPARADGVRLRQVVDNLMSNARKFTPPGGLVSLSAHPGASGWVIEVSDTGIGIAPDEQEHIFDRFFRASNATADHAPGIGLGLAVTRAIVELHGGTVSLTSNLGVGTTVRVEIPATGPADRS